MNFHRWRSTIQHVKQYRQLSESSSYIVSVEINSGDEFTSNDNELSTIMNIYAKLLIKNKSGKFDNNTDFQAFFDLLLQPDTFILSRTESDLNENYQILMENLYYVTAAIQELDVSLKTSSSPLVHRGDIVDIITTL